MERGAVGGRRPAFVVRAAPALDVVERELPAVRVLGIAHGGPLSMSDLQGVSRKLQESVRAAGAEPAGPIFTVLRSNPYEVAPGRRSYSTCLPIRGAVAAPDGTSVARVGGGLFFIAATQGGIQALEAAYGFLFGRLLGSRNHELARPEEPEIRLFYPTPPLEVARETDLVVEIAIPVSTSMRNDTMLNQK